MKRTIYFPEIFTMVGEEQSRAKKIEILQKFKNEKGFLDILRLCYDPKINWLVSRKDIENLVYDHMDIADFDLAPETLFQHARRRLYNYTDVRHPPLKLNKVLRNIATMFSSLHHDEVELFKQMVDGNIIEEGLDELLIRDAFPLLLSEREVQLKRKPGRPSGAKNKEKVEKPKQIRTKKTMKPYKNLKSGKTVGNK